MDRGWAGEGEREAMMRNQHPPEPDDAIKIYHFKKFFESEGQKG